jgi:hypothetical protein
VPRSSLTRATALPQATASLLVLTDGLEGERARAREDVCLHLRTHFLAARPPEGRPPALALALEAGLATLTRWLQGTPSARRAGERGAAAALASNPDFACVKALGLPGVLRGEIPPQHAAERGGDQAIAGDDGALIMHMLAERRSPRTSEGVQCPSC